MATSLAAQLAQIAADSKSTLDVKAQKAAHSKSLIFQPRVAASQNFHSLYAVCLEGFDDLCRLDSRFTQFAATLFSEQSQNEDRTQMTADENAGLDKRINAFLRLVGARLRLMPAIKALEWLVRRFRIHEYNTHALISAFLPYHSIPAFTTLLSILPPTLPPVYRFLRPYVETLTAPPRSAIVHQATLHPDFLAAVSTHALDSCSHQQHYPALIAFWAGVMTEAVNGMLDKMRSGRRNIQRTNDQALLQQIGPILGNAMVMAKAPDLQIASYMVLAVFVAKGDLEDNAITVLMEQLVSGWTTESLRPGLVCLSILAQYRSAKQLSSKLTKVLLKVQGLPQVLVEISKEHNISKLANGLCLGLVDRLHKKGDARGIATIEALLHQLVVSESQAIVIFKSLLLAAHRIDDEVDAQGEVRKALASTIIGLTQAESGGHQIFSKVITDTDVDVDALELRLDTRIRPNAIAVPQDEDTQMKDDEDEEASVEDFASALDRVKGITTAPTDSCLRGSSSGIFADLCSVFLASLTQPQNTEAFILAAPLRREEAHSGPFFCSFFMKIWCGPYPTLARVAALETVKSRLKQDDCQGLDFQALLPYCVAALNDPSKKVRRAAADVAIVLESLAPKGDAKSLNRTIWGKEDLVDDGSLAWMGQDVAHKLFQSVIIPALEECVLNASQIQAVLQSALNSSKDSDKDKKSGLSHSARLSILTFFASHTVGSPLLTVKLRLLAPLNHVKGVSGTTRTQLLLPLLEKWLSLAPEEAEEACREEKVDGPSLDQSSVDIILPNDKAGLDFFFSATKAPELPQRPNLLRALFQRIQKVWPSIKSEAKSAIAHQMLELTQKNWISERNLVSEEAADLLRNTDLTTEILLDFLESLQPTAKMATEPPPGKRRRTSSSEAHRGLGTQTTPELTATLKQVTFVLQLVEGSDPAKHPQLLNALFNALSELQQFRILVGSELGYLQNLVLRSLLAMVPAYKKDPSLKIDPSGGHGDLLVNCIQKSSSPAVQSSALLLVASLANVAPELVLHSVMPIFTFMGSSVLRQSDDYSAHVINQTVKEVVPPLIQSLLKGKKDPVSGASELLLSFVTAYEHIPSHRRLGLFVSLVETLGPSKFLFALLAMLADKYGATDQVLSFSTELFNHFDIETQMHSLISLLSLVSDMFKPKPGLSATLLGVSEEGQQDLEKVALRELSLLPQLLSSRKLTTQISRLSGREDMEAAKLRESYSTLLEDLLSLAESLKQQKTLHARCGDALSKLLNLLSIGEFVKAVETLLDRPDAVLRRKVLRAVEVRIDKEGQSNADSRAVLLAFLPQLTAIIRTSDDVLFKNIAVSCVDKIAEKYGKKDPEAVTAAASTIAGEQCLGQEDKRLRVTALLCLASLVDVLQDGVVPILPSAIPKALSYITSSIGGESHELELHNAGYALITALAQHLPYMMSGAYLQQLLQVSNASAKADLGSEASTSRLQCLQFLAKQADAKVMFTALEQNWESASASGFSAIREYFDIVSLAIDKHPKAQIERNIGPLSAIFLCGFDVRRLSSSSSSSSSQEAATTTTPSEEPGQRLRDVARIEEMVNGTALRMIYKLNDASFRPVFIRLMEWATTGLPKKDARGRNLRLLSVYNFLLTFFDSLKSIVTSYATYMVDSAVGVLSGSPAAAAGSSSSSSSPEAAEARELWGRVLQTLTRCFEHDQDDFWQAPAHFRAVCGLVTAQVGAAAAAAAEDDAAFRLVAEAVVELASAADSAEHQKELNGMLLRQLRSERGAVRLAAVRCEQGLTERLGEEWLAMLPEMLPYISELQDDDDELVERETHRWIVGIESVLGESLDAMLQ